MPSVNIGLIFNVARRIPITSIHMGVVILPRTVAISAISAGNLVDVRKSGRATAIESVAGLMRIFLMLIYFLSPYIMNDASVQPMRLMDRKYIIEYTATF